MKTYSSQTTNGTSYDYDAFRVNIERSKFEEREIVIIEKWFHGKYLLFAHCGGGRFGEKLNAIKIKIEISHSKCLLHGIS